MRWFLAVIAFAFGLHSNLDAALTLTSARETFQGVATLNTASPGNLGTVDSVANFHKRPVGPRLTSDTTALSKGWSADLRILTQTGVNGRHTIALSGGAVAAGMFTAWYYIDTLNANGSNVGYLMDTRISNGNPLLRMGWNPTNGKFVHYRNGIWANTDTAETMPIRQWFEMRMQWLTSGSNCTSVSSDYRLAGSSTWTSLYTTTTTFGMGSPLTEVRGGWLNISGSESYFRGRYGMPSVYTMGTWADRHLAISDVADPAAGATSWYVNPNPAIGNDANDGLTTGTAWQTITKINAESVNCGMFPTAAGYVNGDTLTIDTTSANLILGTASFNILTRGLNVIQLGGGLTGTGEIQAWKSVANASFTKTAGLTNIYQVSDAEVDIVLWEDDKWMNHPMGATLASVQTALDATPGSFWTNGTILYVHPFGSTNPTSDGKSYTRSISRGAFAPSAVQLLAPDLRLLGLRVKKTCMAKATDNDAILGYCVQGLSAAGGLSRVENCYGAYGSKHIFGFTDNDINRQTTVLNCQAEQGSPYGSQTPWVDYSSSTLTGTATTTYINCTTNAGTGLIGSTTGVVAASAGWICHNNGAATYQFANITFTDCNINGTFDTYGAVSQVRYNRGSFGGGVLRNPDSLVSGARMNGTLSCDQTGGSTRVRNSIVTPSAISSGNGAKNAQGTLDYQGNIIDLRATTTNGTTVALFLRFASLTMIWKNNYFIANPAYDFVLLKSGLSTDAYTFTNNAYTLGANFKVMETYNDGTTTADRTFAQWQALGKDASSFTTTAATSIDSSYKPIGGSPLIGAGVNIGPLTDYAGVTTFATRDDIGAYEFISLGGIGAGTGLSGFTGFGR